MSWLRAGTIRYAQRPAYGQLPVDRVWKLGVGPCGKTVRKLEVQLPSKLCPGGMVIRQWCKGQPEPDVFWVPAGTIAGTIQVYPTKEGYRSKPFDD